MLKFTSIITTIVLLIAFSSSSTAMPYRGNIDPTWKEKEAMRKIDDPHTTDGPREKCIKIHESKRSVADIRYCYGLPGGSGFDWMNQ